MRARDVPTTFKNSSFTMQTRGSTGSGLGEREEELRRRNEDVDRRRADALRIASDVVRHQEVSALRRVLAPCAAAAMAGRSRPSGSGSAAPTGRHCGRGAGMLRLRECVDRMPVPPAAARALRPPGEACALAGVGARVVGPLRAGFGGQFAGQVDDELAQPATVCAQPVRPRATPHAGGRSAPAE